MTVRRMVASALCLAAVVLPAAAAAQESGDYIDDYIGRNSPELERTLGDPDVEVLGTTTRRDQLAVTGGDLLGLAVMGAGAVGVGTVFVRSRRRTDETSD